MIASSRLRRVERVAKVECERFEESAWTSGHPTPRMLAERLCEMQQEADECRLAGDFDADVIHRLAGIAKLFEIVRQRIRDAKAAQ